MNPALLRWFLLIPLALIWGSSFILIKKGLVGLSPFELGALRLFCASVFLIVAGFRSLTKIPLGKWKYLALTAACGSFFPAFLFAMGQTHISSSISAVLNSLTPVNALLIGIFIYKLDFKRIQIFGVLIGVIGCGLLIFGNPKQSIAADLLFVALVYIASVLYAANVNFIKAYLSDVPPLAISAGNASVMLIPAALILLFNGFPAKLSLPEIADASIYVVILGIIGTGIANLLFFRLIQLSGPVFASSVTYLIPLVAFIWGVLDGESLTLIQCIGGAIVLSGVYLSSRK